MSLETPTAKLERPARTKPVRAAPRLAGATGRQIARFTAGVRPELRRLVRASTRAAELLDVFPGALYAIAIRHGGTQVAEASCRLIDDGAPLKAVAAALDLPMWLRRLPPEAFTGDLSGLPRDESFARRVPARLPARPMDAADWLAATRFSTMAAGSDFALWVVRHRLHTNARERRHKLVLLAAYAWHSLNPQSRAGELVWTRWRPEMAPDTAICAAKSWFNRIMLCTRLPGDRSVDPWLEAGHADGLDFVPLTNCEAVLDEANAMSNCTDQYAGALGFGRCRLFSVRCAGQNVATLEVVPHPRETGVLTIGQLKGRGNAPAPLDVWQSAFRWLASQRRLLQSTYCPRPLPADAATWHELLSPYRNARGGAPWLPAAPNGPALDEIESGLGALARDANIRSWLFL